MNYRGWRAVAFAVLAVILLVLLARGCSSPTDDPTAYVKKTYQRESSLDENGINAYVAADESPQRVASDISANADPIDRRTSSENAATDGGDAVFLQYSDKIVGIFPHDGGSKIMLGDYARAHSYWFVFVGGWWGSTPGYSGGGSGNRGGGVGTGK